MKITRTTVIRRPPSAVWSKLEARAGGRLDDFGDEAFAQGFGSEAPDRPEVIVRRDEKVEMRLPAGPLPFSMLARLDEAAEGTQTTLVIELTLPFLLRPFSPFVGWFLGRELATELRRLKKDAETSE